MSSWKDLYSEVKKRKMEALNKKDIVKAVENHGKILAIEGKFEKPKKVVEYMYASEKRVIKPNDILKFDLNNYDVLLIGCPGNDIPSVAYSKIRDYVLNGNYLITTDWAIRTIIEPIFPGYIRWNEIRTEEAVVPCQIIEPNHPFLEGVLGEITQNKWQTHDMKNTEFSWWLEIKSFPIQIVNPDAVHILIVSQEIKKKWGEAPVMVYFDFGKKGGKIIHMISHTHLQKGGSKGKYASAIILTNILDEKISQKMNLGKKPEQRYVSDWESPSQQQTPQKQLEEQWVMPNQNTEYVTPSIVGKGIELSGTAQIIEANDSNFSFSSKCVYCNNDFVDFSGKIYICKECGACYHENCLNIQIQEGSCKKCSRILLW